MYINNDDFEKWMERLSKKLNDIGKRPEMACHTTKFSTRTKTLDDQDLCFMLRVRQTHSLERQPK